MKWFSWKPTLCCGIAFISCMTGLNGDRSVKAEDKPNRGQRGNQSQAGNRGNSSPGKSHSRGAGGPGVSNRGGIHAPSFSQPHQSAGRTIQRPSVGRSPSFTQPRIGQRPNLSKTGASAGPRVNVHPGTGSSRGVQPRVSISPSRNLGGTRTGIVQGLRNNIGVGGWTHSGGRSGLRDHNHNYSGNTFNYSNRNFNLSNNAYRPAYYRHSGYHGFWNNNRGYNYGYYGISNNNYYGYGSNYGYRPFGWGLGGWGLGSILYNSGYLGYSNPYYVGVGSSGYNYSQPIPVSYRVLTTVDNKEPDSADEAMKNAVAAFQQNDYDAALDITNKGIAQNPDDAVLHEFRALVLFARGDYQQAAATIHSVLAVGPGWDWTTLSSLYSDLTLYTSQLRALEASTNATPQDAATRFLLAYHYMCCGHTDAVVRQLQQVVQLKPNDRVAVDLLKMIAPPEASNPGTEPPQPSADPTQSTQDAVNPAMLVGTWQATRPDGAQFNLTLTNDTKFNWSFTPKNQKPQSFGGTYTLEGNVLALEGDQAGSLIAEVTPGQGTDFNFKVVGAPGDDPGLDFKK